MKCNIGSHQLSDVWLSYIAEQHSLQAVTLWCSLSAKPTIHSVWSLQHYNLCSLAPKNKTATYRQMLLLGGNAAGNCKLKPLFMYHVVNPRALKLKAKGMLPVIWKPNSNAWVTETVFREWFSIHFVPAVRHCCSQNNLLLKHSYFWTTLLGKDIHYRTFIQKLKLFFCLLIWCAKFNLWICHS